MVFNENANVSIWARVYLLNRRETGLALKKTCTAINKLLNYKTVSALVNEIILNVRLRYIRDVDVHSSPPKWLTCICEHPGPEGNVLNCIKISENRHASTIETYTNLELPFTVITPQYILIIM